MTFLSGSVTPFHAAEVMANTLQRAGFEQLEQFDAVRMTPGKGYFIVHQGSSLMAVRAGHSRR
jgi:aspartyl aminopeptidase